MPYIEVMESFEHSADWNEFQSQVLRRLWQGRFKRHWSVDLSKYLPEKFVRRLTPGSPAAASPLVSRASGQWRIVVAGTNGQSAIVELGSEYQVVRATIQR